MANLVEVFLDAESRCNSVDDATTSHDIRLEPKQRGSQHPLPRETTPRTADPKLRLGASRVWAVLIGIDGYSSYPLRGCVADALAVEQYLAEDLLVPRERIQSLLGPANCVGTPTDVSSVIPSRTNIISILLSLITNSIIEYGDPIIIFFAGHGSRYSLSDKDGDDDPDSDKEHDDEQTRKFVEVLCPVDRNTLDDSGALIPDISDRELNTILSEISRTKGHRITFILDCCHAGSITRTLSSKVRTAPPLEHASVIDMLLAGEEDLRDLSGYRSILGEGWRPDMDSHVILAACRGGETAKSKLVRKEKKGTEVWGGVFTKSLIKLLKSDVLGEDATYQNLIDSLPPLRHQTPIVTGGRKNTHLWYQD
ncbi:caspase domain-containing protein [Desarmillaria tabescens]|uniref:Caspase domain-containing protein n=1 Tax=Armillaria tabescens TaxID=1929756 RepID=A0AA39MPY3_ARMTA|nr:caspase domain-containing protein [Desarmillaria tabescens]KAK0441724.1 caspase domain-containing protein [Desarmillaria tabescens]